MNGSPADGLVPGDLIERMHEGFAAFEVVRVDGEPVDCRYLYLNDAFVLLTGLSPVEVVGRPLTEVVPGLEPDWVADLVRVGVEQSPATFTRYASPLERWYDIRAFPLGDERLGVLFLDATGRERADEALQERAEAMERRLVASGGDRTRTWEVTPDLLSVIGVNGAFEQVNPAWTTSLGHAADELVGSSFLHWLHPDDETRSLAAFERVVSGDEPVLRFENRYRHADGSWRWLSWVVVPEHGRLFCSARDVTADKAREAKLAERNRIWNASNDLYVIIGMDGRYRELNPAWARQLGHDPEALVGTAFDALVRPDLLEAVGAEFERLVGGGLVSDYEIPVRAADGAYRWYAFTGFVEGDDILVIGRDVDERKRREAELAAAEEALRQSQKLEMIGQLTGGIAHDFNNLLMAMQSSLELLDSTLDPADAHARALLGDALAGAARGAALTQRLLAFARKQELATGPVDVGALIHGMADLMSHSLGPRVRIRIAAAAGAPRAAVDGNQLEMALLNLAVNARDAMDGEGDLSFVVEAQRSSGRGPLPKGSFVRVTVTDTGCGMDAATLEKATEPFFTTKEIGSGTGLGLSMIHGLTEQSGGQFRLTSEPGVGTIAEILLPAAVGLPAAPVPPPDVSDPAVTVPAVPSPRRILVVDDDALVLRGMAGILARGGHDVLRAESGALALQLLAREAPVDVVITDQLMPGMTGLELAVAVRREHPGTAIILATGYTDAGDIDPGLVDARLAKPFDRRRLEHAVASVGVSGSD